LNATYKYPPYPQFSTRLKSFIGAMLKEDPKKRPNIYQVISEVCSMRGTKVPIKDVGNSCSLAKSATDSYRFTPSEHNQKRVALKNYRIEPQQSQLLHLSASAIRRLSHRLRLYLTYSRCVVEDQHHLRSQPRPPNKRRQRPKVIRSPLSTLRL